MKRLKVGNVTRERVRIPDTAAEARLRRALKGYAATAYVFARNTGLRLGELRRLRREDIDGDRVYVPVAKSGKGRFVPLMLPRVRRWRSVPATVCFFRTPSNAPG